MANLARPLDKQKTYTLETVQTIANLRTQGNPNPPTIVVSRPEGL